jgi:hypothetical protein
LEGGVTMEKENWRGQVTGGRNKCSGCEGSHEVPTRPSDTDSLKRIYSFGNRRRNSYENLTVSGYEHIKNKS